MLIGKQGVAIVSAILATGLCMIYPLWAVFGVVTGILLFSNICLLVWDIPLGLHCTLWILITRPSPTTVHVINAYLEVTVYYLLGFTSCVTPILFPWVNIIMRDDNEARSFTTGAMVGYVTAKSTNENDD